MKLNEGLRALRPFATRLSGAGNWLALGLLLGVLDIDSPVHDRFSAADAANLETCAAILVAASDTPPWLNTNNG